MAEKFQPLSVSKLDNDYDVIVIGSGGTGLSAAIQANELGMKTVVLEKEEELGGNTNRASSGMNAAETNVQLQHGVIDNVADFYHETYKDGGRLNDKDMLGYFVYHTAPAIDWLADHGIKLDDITITGGMSRKRTHRPASMAPIGGFLVKSLLEVVQKENIPVFNKVKVNKLLQDDEGKVIGVEANADGLIKTIHAKAVILATGGFGASKEYMKRFRPDLADYKTTNQPGATGDGLKLAEGVGGELMQMDLVQVHPTVQQDNPHVYLIGEAVRGEGAILVNAEGNRFVNELNTRKIVSNAITALPEHSAYLIFDQGIRDHAKAIEFYDKVGLVVHGGTIEDLAKNLNMDPENLKKTVATISQWIWWEIMPSCICLEWLWQAVIDTWIIIPRWCIRLNMGIPMNSLSMCLTAMPWVLSPDLSVCLRAPTRPKLIRAIATCWLPTRRGCTASLSL